MRRLTTTTLRPISVIALLFLLQGAATVQAESPYMGLVYPPLPEGCKFQGWLMKADEVGGQLPALNVEAVACGKTEMAWLGESVGQGPPNVRWRVIDVLTIPLLEVGKSFLIPENGCEYADYPQTEVYAIGHWVPSDYGGNASNITRAWILNKRTKRFEAVSPAKVTCGYEEDRD